MNHIKRFRWLQSNCYVGRDLRGTKMLRGEDLSGFDFMDADLTGADLSKCTGRGVDLRCANLQGANLSGARAHGWLLTGAQMRGASLEGAAFDRKCQLQGVDLTNASINGMAFRPNGALTRGLMLPASFDARSIRLAYDNNYIVGRLLAMAFPRDREIEAIATFVMAHGTAWQRPDLLPCWEGAVAWVQHTYPRRVEDVISVGRAAPESLAAQRWEFALAALGAESPESLRRHPHAKLFRRHLEFIEEHRWPEKRMA